MTNSPDSKWFRKWRTPARWQFFQLDDRLLLILTGIIVGIFCGFASIVLMRSLAAVFDWLRDYSHRWWVFLLPAAGAALSNLFLEKVVQEGAGHGVPEVVYSVSRKGGLIRFRSSFSRLISSCLTIGSGGSAGPEAPVVMSGAAIGSNIARLFSFNDRQRVTLVGCGAAGAIASIFNAPIAGMIFASEVVLSEWSALNLVPVAIAAVAGTEISRLFQGDQIPFSHQAFFIDLTDITAAMGLAVLTAAASLLLTHAMRFMHRSSKRLPVPNWVRAAIGGCLVGLIGLVVPIVLGEGYSAVEEMIGGVFPHGLLVVAVALLAKILATSLTLGWGGSGGIFAPCLVLGSLSGLAYHRALLLLWPSSSWVNEGCFALLGMAGMISGILQAPLTAIFLIVEITGGYGVILPLIAVSAVSTVLCHYFEPASFYLRDLVEQGQLLRPGTDARVLSDLSVQELLETDCIPVSQNMLLREFIAKVVKKSHRNYFPVEHESTGAFLGMIHLDDIRPFLFDQVMYDTVLLGQIMNPRVQVAHPGDDLNDVLQQMDRHHLFSMPVVSNDRFLGMISKATLLDQYRKELQVQACL